MMLISKELLSQTATATLQCNIAKPRSFVKDVLREGKIDAKRGKFITFFPELI